MKKAHKLSALIDQTVIDLNDLKKGKVKKSFISIIDYVHLHSDGSMTGIIKSKNKLPVSFNPALNVWVF